MIRSVTPFWLPFRWNLLFPPPRCNPLKEITDSRTRKDSMKSSLALVHPSFTSIISHLIKKSPAAFGMINPRRFSSEALRWITVIALLIPILSLWKLNCTLLQVGARLNKGKWRHPDAFPSDESLLNCQETHTPEYLNLKKMFINTVIINEE